MAEEITPLLEIGERVSNPTKRLGVPMAAVFVVGTICGSGVLAIPRAIVDAGWAGVALLILSGCLAAYTGVLLGKCWSLLQGRYPEYALLRVTDPYPMIGLRAAGKLGQYATRFCIDATLFGGATVFILLIADNIVGLMWGMGHVKFYTCDMLMIIWCFLTPLSWFGTPKDFWQAAVIAAITTSVGAVLIAIGVILDAPAHEGANVHKVTAGSFFNAFGTIMYAFGGASIFPTIQVDMANPARFPTAVTIGTAVVLCLYLPAGISGFMVFKDDMDPNVLSSLSIGGISYAVNILITSHLLMAFVIISNPVTQEIEGFFNVPDRFTWKRVLLRTIYTLCVLFVALTIPHFSVILALVGGSTIACTTFIFPPLFYYLLSRQKSPEEGRGPPPGDFPVIGSASYETVNGLAAGHTFSWSQLNIRPSVKVFLFLIIAIGVGGGLSSTYFAISAVITGRTGFTVPCYVNNTVG